MPTSAAEPSSSQNVGISGPCIICLSTPSALTVHRRITPPDDPSRDMARATASFTISSASCRFMPSLQEQRESCGAIYRRRHAALCPKQQRVAHALAAISRRALQAAYSPQEMQVVPMSKVGSIVGIVRQTCAQKTSFSWLTKHCQQTLVWLSFLLKVAICNHTFVQRPCHKNLTVMAYK